jgi:hypothetical protein
MGWNEVITVLQEEVMGTIEGTFTPQDNIPFFTVCYPPEEEVNAIKEFTFFLQRLQADDVPSGIFSMKDVLKEALIELGVASEDSGSAIAEYERSKNRKEIKEDLTRYLPEQVSDIMLRKLRDKDRNYVAMLLRTGALYPFVRTSSIRAKMENKIRCVAIIAYPANNIGEMLNDASFKLGAYYRGEIIYWR